MGLAAEWEDRERLVRDPREKLPENVEQAGDGSQKRCSSENPLSHDSIEMKTGKRLRVVEWLTVDCWNECHGGRRTWLRRSRIGWYNQRILIDTCAA